MIDVVLLDGENRSTLAACRSLGRRGLKVAVIGPAGSIAHASKFCEQVIVESSDPKTYLEELKAHLKELRPNLFLPMSDRSLEIVSNDENLYAKAPLPSLASLEKVQGKEPLLNLCSELSVKIPKSQVVNSIADISEWKSFPAILKIAQAGDPKRKIKPPVRYFENKLYLQNFLSHHPTEFPWLLQERIVGPGVGVFVLAQEGEVLTTFCHERILDKPPSGGVSVLSKSIPREEAPIAEATRLIKALNWTGVAMVEFKYCSQTGEPFFMEINPRFWGSLQLSVSCGVDFPWLLYLMNKMELGSKEGVKALEAARNYRVGRRLRWDLGTVDHFFIRLKLEKLAAFNDVLFRNQLHFSLSSDTVHETIAGDDPDPFWRELGNYFKAVLK